MKLPDGLVRRVFVIQHDRLVFQPEHRLDLLLIGVVEHFDIVDRYAVLEEERAHDHGRDCGMRINRARATKRISGAVGKCRAFFCVRRSGPSSLTIMPGSAVKMQSRLITTPLASTMPISRPMAKLINSSASRPTIVVTELLVIAPNAPASAFFIAEAGSGSLCRSSA